jgi:hypothetical protein
LANFSLLWYVLPRKIWQPRSLVRPLRSCAALFAKKEMNHMPQNGFVTHGEWSWPRLILNPELEFFPILHEQCVDLERWSVFSLPFN